ncbi:unnamed protein product [Pleuronectes platessa]|uniref:Uncharacterized protein n=1 Tax=Pleuronectes platessa TaxID=8262 RepID=A0A9N7YV12_PLEPL|nr:unnamed protein product [Pleuronectes platessa]
MPRQRAFSERRRKWNAFPPERSGGKEDKKESGGGITGRRRTDVTRTCLPIQQHLLRRQYLQQSERLLAAGAADPSRLADGLVIVLRLELQSPGCGASMRPCFVSDTPVIRHVHVCGYTCRDNPFHQHHHHHPPWLWLAQRSDNAGDKPRAPTSLPLLIRRGC